MKIYSIKDVGTGFGQVFTANNDYMATRLLTDTVNGPQPSLITQYPKDFSLYLLGEMNQDSGIITPENGSAKFICNAIDVLKTKPADSQSQKQA